jgi:hypothetical protein
MHVLERFENAIAAMVHRATAQKKTHGYAYASGFTAELAKNLAADLVNQGCEDGLEYWIKQLDNAAPLPPK